MPAEAGAIDSEFFSTVLVKNRASAASACAWRVGFSPERRRRRPDLLARNRSSEDPFGFASPYGISFWVLLPPWLIC